VHAAAARNPLQFANSERTNERTNFIRQRKRHWQVTSTGIGPSKLATKNKKKTKEKQKKLYAAFVQW